MSLINSITKATTSLGILAAVAALPQSTQAQFNPVEPGVILSGSAGFTDIYVFASAARENFFDDAPVATSLLESEFNARTVRSNIDGSPIENQLITTNGSLATSLDFQTTSTGFTPLTIDSFGRIDGIATMNAGQNSRLVPIVGRAIFREYVGRIYAPSSTSSAGSFSNEFPAYFTNILNRNIDHELDMRGNDRQGFAFALTLRARAFQESGRQIKNSYDPTPNLLRGILRTRGGVGTRTGLSQVEVIGIFEDRATFQIPASSLVANSSFSSWAGTATLGLPTFSPTPLQGGQSAVRFSFYNTRRDRPGRYIITHKNNFTEGTYRARSTGYFMNTQDEVAQVGSGFRSLADLEYRDQNFGFATPSAITVVQSLYRDPLDILIRNNTFND
ncbi:MAG: hypothetical protein ACFCU1_06260 [Sumerlaeia bacterium]